MGLFDTLFNLGRSKPPMTINTPTRRPLPVAKRARQTVNEDGGSFFFGTTMPPAGDTYDYWRIQLTDPDDLAALPVDQIQKIMARVSPEISKAWWDFVIFVGNMTEVKVYREQGSDEVDESAQAMLDQFIDLLDDQHSSSLNLIHRIISGGFLRGAFAAELVLDKNGRLPIDLATPDPQSFRFRQVNDPQRGEIWELGQWQNGVFVSFADMPTVKYVPIVPEVGTPYAVSWMEAAIFPGLFLIMLLQDVRRVIANFGYPREDISVDLERLKNSMPADLQTSPDAFKNWTNDTIQEIIDVIETLEPGMAWVHTDVAMRQELKGAIGGSGANFANQVDQMIESLERMLIRGLKTVPFLLASRQSTTERQADREWEAYTTGIDIVQRKLKFLLDNLFTLALEVQGIQSIASVEFAESGAFDALRDAQVEQIQIQNEIEKRKQGWINNNEASETITGSPAVDEPEQTAVPPQFTSNDEDNEEDNSGELLAEIKRARIAIAERMLEHEPTRNGHH